MPEQLTTLVTTGVGAGTDSLATDDRGNVATSTFAMSAAGVAQGTVGIRCTTAVCPQAVA